MNKNLNILHISDTHGFHSSFIYPEETIDIVIHSGDSTNIRSPYMNEREFMDFIYWYKEFPAKYKIYVAGNHDSYIFEANTFARKLMKDLGVIYLEDTGIEIEGIKFWGTPWTPRFGDWCFMKDRAKMYKVWERVPVDTNVLITHGPPMGILDITQNRDRTYDICGDKSIHNYFDKWEDMKYICFGHIHDSGYCLNYGIKEYKEIKFVNSASVEDSRFDKGLIHHGNIINI